MVVGLVVLAVGVMGAPQGAYPAAFDYLALKGHTGPVWSVAFSPDGRLLASGGQDGTVRIWDVATRRILRILSTGGKGVTAVAFTPDGTALVGDSIDATRLWSTRTWTVAYILKRRTADSGSIAISPNGALLARIGGYLGRTIELWDLRDRRVIRTLVGTERGVDALAFSPDGRSLASGGDDGFLRIWDIPSGTLRQIITPIVGVRSVAWSPDGRTLASAVGAFQPSPGVIDLKITLWDPVAGTVQRRLGSYPENGDFIQVVAYSPDGQFIAGGSWRSEKVGIFRVQTGEEIRAYWAHTRMVTSLAFSPDSRLLASASDDATIRLWPFRP